MTSLGVPESTGIAARCVRQKMAIGFSGEPVPFSM
jgi:hypothetical protein